MKIECDKDDLYGILGVEPSASADEVRKAYKQRALETHPDKLNLDAGCTAEEKEEAERRFRAVYDAFVVLGDNEKRKAYDTAHGHKSRVHLEEKWATFSAQSLQRAQERQAWADEREARYRERMVALREASRVEREGMGDEWARGREEREMVTRMLGALCALSGGAQVKGKSKGKVAGGKSKGKSSKKRVVSAPAGQKFNEQGKGKTAEKSQQGPETAEAS